MTKIITNERLEKAVVDQTFIKGGNPDCAEGVKYDFRLGNEILKAEYNQPLDMSEIPAIERKAFVVAPGEVVFVLTEEQIDLPDNMVAVLSPKRKLAHEGIATLGGSLIDPLYSGKLLVGLYNFSSTPWPLMPGRKLIAAVFYELEGEELGEFPIPEKITEFPNDLIQIIQKYKPIQIQDLRDALEKTQKELSALKVEITSGREWIQEFRASLQGHSKLIGDVGRELEVLSRSLSLEIENRSATEQAFRDELRGIQDRVIATATRLGLVVGVSVLVIAAILAWFIPLIIDKTSG